MAKEQLSAVDEIEPGESRTSPTDPFSDMLPLLLSQESPENREPLFGELPPSVQARYTQQAQHRARLAAEGLYATGTDVAIFVSEVGTNERLMNDIISQKEYAEHTQAAVGIEHQIKQITGQGVNVSIIKATNEAINEALANRNVAHMIFIGHSNRSRLATGVGKRFEWSDPEQPIDHLKSSFGVFGCGARAGLSGQTPRVGMSFVDPEGILYGVPGDYLDEGTPYQFDELVRLPSQDLEGTPAEIVNPAA